MTSSATEHDATGDCLDGVRVVELGDGIAGSIATMTLAMLGADVTKVVHPIRPIGKIGPEIVGGDRHISALAVAMDGRKRLVTDAQRHEYLG